MENREVAAGTFLLRLEAPAVARIARPGQFVMVRTGPSPAKGTSPLLKRPFSLHRIGSGGEIDLLYRVVGEGTSLLSQVRSLQGLEVMGPLGRGFEPPDPLPRAYLAAGGVGLAPLLALAETLAGSTETILFYGARSDDDLVSAPYLELFQCRVLLCTDDGSVGFHGPVTEPLAEVLEASPAPVFACGPRPMLARVAELAAGAGVAAQVSMEANMACGMGACLGCVVQTNEPAYTRVCLEGPVFRAEDIQW